MNQNLKAGVICVAAAVLCVAAFILVPHLRDRGRDAGGIALAGDSLDHGEDGSDVSRDVQSLSSSRSKRSVRTASSFGVPLNREKAKFDVGEMRNEVEDMVRKFRGTPEERQDVIDECEDGKELIQWITEATESSIEKMSNEELEKERANFEKDYRAQLDYLQTGRLQRMLKTPEEQEVIGSAIEAVQNFLEQLDNSLHSAGY